MTALYQNRQELSTKQQPQPHSFLHVQHPCLCVLHSPHPAVHRRQPGMDVLSPALVPTRDSHTSIHKNTYPTLALFHMRPARWVWCCWRCSQMSTLERPLCARPSAVSAVIMLARPLFLPAHRPQDAGAAAVHCTRHLHTRQAVMLTMVVALLLSNVHDHKHLCAPSACCNCNHSACTSCKLHTECGLAIRP
jgi:hypothetical protein